MEGQTPNGDTTTMQHTDTEIATDEIEELRWYLENSTPHVGYFGQDVSCQGDVYRIVNEDAGEFVAHFKSKDDAMFFLHARALVAKLIAERGGEES